MKISATEEEIAAARSYENLHVPALFRQWAPRVLEAAGFHPGMRLLDVACGTGVIAREAAKSHAIDGLIAGLDAGAGMLAVAQQVEPSVEWTKGVAEALPYGDESFDVVACQFGLMFFQDRAAAIGEMARVLAPKGRLVTAVWDSLENMEAFPVEVALLERMAGQQAAEALKAPFVLGNMSDLEALFKDAPLTAPGITTLRGKATFPSIKTMVEADLRGWLPIMGIVLSEADIESILDAAELELAPYVTDKGTVEFTASAHIITCTKK